jgi:glycosyltransferase involved in cell wall biosynthesis
MKISGFSYVRNGFDYGVPFLEAYRSVLPVCDEFIVAVGDSTDGTREAIEKLQDNKIRIIDTVWDTALRNNGKIFAQQSNTALDAVSGDWAFHIQADEVIHEKDLPRIKKAIEDNDADKRVEGFILPFIHFWGGYDYIRTSRRVHPVEVRIFRNGLNVRAYRDSQGFRKFRDFQAYENGTEKGEKLRVKKIDAPIYHYTEVRGPKLKTKKAQTIGAFYEKTPPLVEQVMEQYGYDRLEKFKGTHPRVMQEKVNAQDWKFVFDPKKSVWRTKDRIMQPIEDFIGFRIGEYKNYKLIKK